MKKYLIIALLLTCGVSLYAQDSGPADKTKTAADGQKKNAQAQASKPAAVKTAKAAPPAEKKAVKAAPAAPSADKQADQDNEESVVMIDSKGEADDNGRFSAGEDREERTVPGGLPSSYGQCKGVINEGGRSLLVFESPEDGTVSLIQVVAGKNNVAWKLVGRIPRSAD